MLGKSVCILLAGRAGVGKTTSAQFLYQRLTYYGYSTTIASFAWGLKSVAKAGFGWDGKKDDKGRKLLQDLGAVGRAYNPNIWVKYTFDNYLGTLPDYPFDFVLVDDWRFPNEYDYIKNKQTLYSPYKVRINAPDREILAGTERYNDISETSLPSTANYYDYILFNTQSMTVLHARLELIIGSILERELSYVKET